MTGDPAASRRAGITGRAFSSDRYVPLEVCSLQLPLTNALGAADGHHAVKALACQAAR